MVFSCGQATFLTWFGYELCELAGSRRFQDLLSVGGRIFYETHNRPLLKMQGSVAEVKFDIKHRDGQALPILVNIVDRSDEHGKRRQIAVFMAEDRAKYEHELVLARQRAEDLRDQLTRAREIAEDRALLAEQTVAIVGHDLRDLLMAVSLGVNAVRTDPVTLRQQRLLAQISVAVDRASRSINYLLDFTQIRVGHGIRVHPVRMNVHACTSGALAELRLSCVAGTRSSYTSKKALPDQLADADRVTQFIGNLVANANAYGDPTLPITVSSIGKPDGFEIRVHNHGTPIPERLLGKMFEPMTRGDGASEGIALACSSSARSSRHMAVDMEVHSTRSDGTSFRGHFAAGRFRASCARVSGSRRWPTRRPCRYRRRVRAKVRPIYFSSGPLHASKYHPPLLPAEPAVAGRRLRDGKVAIRRAGGRAEPPRCSDRGGRQSQRGHGPGRGVRLRHVGPTGAATHRSGMVRAQGGLSKRPGSGDRRGVAAASTRDGGQRQLAVAPCQGGRRIRVCQLSRQRGPSAVEPG